VYLANRRGFCVVWCTSDGFGKPLAHTCLPKNLRQKFHLCLVVSVWRA
jgi:hypothetical protein